MFGARKRKREEATALVLEVTQEFLQARGVGRRGTLRSHLSQAEIGLDSIACLELMAEVERRGSMSIPERHWEAVPKMTLGGLVNLVVKRG